MTNNSFAQVQNSPAYVRLQSTTPGVQQNGNSNINGTSIAGAFNAVTGVANAFAVRAENTSSATSATALYASASASSGQTTGAQLAAPSPDGIGVLGTGGNKGGSFIGQAATSYGVYGEGANIGGWFVGRNSNGTGVYGNAAGQGVLGQSTNGKGVYGLSSSSQGLYGETTTGSSAIWGRTNSASSFAGNAAIYGSATSCTGVFGQSTNGRGLYGKSTNDIAVWGETSSSNYAIVGMNFGGGGGITGQCSTGRGLYGKSVSDIGVWGETEANNYAVVGVNLGTGSGGGVYGQSSNNPNSSGLAIYGLNPNAVGNCIAGECRGNGTGVTGRTLTGVGVAGFSNPGGGQYFPGSAVNGHSTNAFGVAGICDANGSAGVIGVGNNGAWGMYCQGSFGATGTKAFEIDHPLDPENKLLDHYCAEGPEPLLVYRGNVVLNSRGEATVALPDYFDAINRDVTYQLTAIGAAAPDLHVSQRVQNNRFGIAGGKAGLEVSWTVTGVRNDKYVQTYGAPVEKAKPANMRGRYLRPELYGASKEMAMYRTVPASSLAQNTPTGK
ncbi:MAG: hypothetical protein JSS66_17870 [Armatimonadetes bacterium]|nr:hypothetical protein [Armatimonadota bacterium]